jgi:hypothetical protein
VQEPPQDGEKEHLESVRLELFQGHRFLPRLSLLRLKIHRLLVLQRPAVQQPWRLQLV